MQDIILSIKNLYMLYISNSHEDNPIVQLLSAEQSKPAMLLTNINMTVCRNERLGLVGESGSGKSLTVKSITGLTNISPGILNGEITYFKQKPYPLLKSNIFSRENEKQLSFAKYLKHKMLIKIGLHTIIKDSIFYYPDSFIFNANTLIYIYDEDGNYRKVEHVYIYENSKKHQVKILSDYDGFEQVYLYGQIQIYLPSNKNRLINSAIKNFKKKGESIFGKELSYTFQDPKTFLNPYWSIEKQLEDILSLYTDDPNIDKTIDDLLIEQELNPDIIRNMLPSELSGGQIQRIMILIAKVSKPELLIADEPTTGLDLTLKKKIVAMYRERKRSMIFISHDLNMVRHIASRINVIYAGEIIENCQKEDFQSDRRHHPYTKNLIQMQESGYKQTPLQTNRSGNQVQTEQGCAYLGKGCPYGLDICGLISPPSFSNDNLIVTEDTLDEQWIKCWNIQ